MDSIQVPVESHVLKYLKGNQEEEVYFLSEADNFGLFLFQLLRRPRQEKRRDNVLTEYESRWEVHLGAYGCGHRGFQELTGKAVYQFNTFIHRLVIAELHAYVELAIDHGQQAKFAIEGFMLKYEFGEEDIQFATLQKSWTRYWSRKKKKKKKVHSLTGRLHAKDYQKRPPRMAVPA